MLPMHPLEYALKHFTVLRDVLPTTGQYQALKVLARTPMTAAELGKALGVSRQHAHYTLQQLINKGYVYKTTEDAKTKNLTQARYHIPEDAPWLPSLCG